MVGEMKILINMLMMLAVVQIAVAEKIVYAPDSWDGSIGTSPQAGYVVVTNAGSSGQFLQFSQGSASSIYTGFWSTVSGSGDFKADGSVLPTATWNFNQKSLTNATILGVHKTLGSGFMWGAAGDGWKYAEIDEGVPLFGFYYGNNAQVSYGAAGWDWQGNALHNIANGSVFNDAVAYGQLTAATNSVYIMGTNYSYGIALTMYGLLDPRITGLELRTNAWNVAETNARAATAASLVDRISGTSATNSFATAAQGTKADNAVTNNGCTINGQSIANGAALTISGTGITSAVVKAITTYGTTNPVFTINESTNVWSWNPPTNVPITCTFSGPGAGYAASGMIRLSRTNNDNTVTWPTNVTWFVAGTRTATAPTLAKYNRIVVDYFDNMWTLGLVSTNSTSL
jgi:hypothetical protein